MPLTHKNLVEKCKQLQAANERLAARVMGFDAFTSTMNESAIKAVVEEQARDDGLWFRAQTMPEAYLQQELRRLHAAIEGNECAVADLENSLKF